LGSDNGVAEGSSDRKKATNRQTRKVVTEPATSEWMYRCLASTYFLRHYIRDNKGKHFLLYSSCTLQL